MFVLKRPIFKTVGNVGKHKSEARSSNHFCGEQQ